MRHLILAKGLWGFVKGSFVLGSKATASEATLFRLRLQKSVVDNYIGDR